MSPILPSPRRLILTSCLFVLALSLAIFPFIIALTSVESETHALWLFLLFVGGLVSSFLTISALIYHSFHAAIEQME